MWDMVHDNSHNNGRKFERAEIVRMFHLKQTKRDALTSTFNPIIYYYERIVMVTVVWAELNSELNSCCLHSRWSGENHAGSDDWSGHGHATGPQQSL